MTHNKGWDFFTADPGQPPPDVNCKVCGDALHVDRNCDGPTSFIQSMGGLTRIHDQYFCPNTNKGWHVQAYLLRQEIKKTASPQLAKLIGLDLAEVLRIRQNIQKEGYEPEIY